MNSLSKAELEKVKTAADIICHSLSARITIPDLAIQVNLSERKLQDGFKLLFAVGVHAYLSSKRLEYVQTLLLEDMPLKHIALIAGYKDKSTLFKAFRAKYNLTPAKWKKHYINKQANP